MRFRVNTPPVIHQTLDGEVIAVNLDTGTYYSIDGTGAEIWAAIERGASVEEAAAGAVARYGAAGEVEPAVTHFVEELVGEELFVAAEGVGAPAPSNEAAVIDGAPTPRFTPPGLNRFTDLQDL